MLLIASVTVWSAFFISQYLPVLCLSYTLYAVCLFRLFINLVFDRPQEIQVAFFAHDNCVHGPASYIFIRNFSSLLCVYMAFAIGIIKYAHRHFSQFFRVVISPWWIHSRLVPSMFNHILLDFSQVLITVCFRSINLYFCNYLPLLIFFPSVSIVLVFVTRCVILPFMSKSFC